MIVGLYWCKKIYFENKFFFFTLQKKPRKKKEKDPNDKKQSKLKFLNADFVNDSIKWILSVFGSEEIQIDWYHKYLTWKWNVHPISWELLCILWKIWPFRVSTLLHLYLRRFNYCTVHVYAVGLNIWCKGWYIFIIIWPHVRYMT